MKNLLKTILYGFIFGISFLFTCYVFVKAWNFTDPSEVSNTDTLTSTKRNQLVESLFWHRDGTNDISFTAGNASVNTPTSDTHIANKAYVDDQVSIDSVYEFSRHFEIPASSSTSWTFDLNRGSKGLTIETNLTYISADAGTISSKKLINNYYLYQNGEQRDNQVEIYSAGTRATYSSLSIDPVGANDQIIITLTNTNTFDMAGTIYFKFISHVADGGINIVE